MALSQTPSGPGSERSRPAPGERPTPKLPIVDIAPPRRGGGPPPGTSADEASAPPESDLLARLKAGDDRAFEQLVRESTPRMLVVARRMLRSESDAEDAVQSAFLSAFRALAGFNGESRLSTWLHRITVNACLMKLRSAKRRPERAIEDLLPRYQEDGHAERSYEPWQPGPEIGIQSPEDRRRVYDLIRGKVDELPEAYRTVLIMRDIENIPTETAAEMLGLSGNALKTRLHRARQALRNLLDPHLSAAGERNRPDSSDRRGGGGQNK